MHDDKNTFKGFYHHLHFPEYERGVSRVPRERMAVLLARISGVMGVILL